MRGAFVLLLGSALVLGCADSSSPGDTTTKPVLAIVDGAHGGNSHFYFFPPMVAAPGPTGTFDGSLAPSVEICVWHTVAEVCGASLAIYNTTTGPGSESVRVDAAEELYIVNWHTGEILDNVPLGANEVYRIRVLVGTKELGHADVAVAGSMRELKNVDTDEFVPVMDGRTLPIKFRIEVGALVEAETLSGGQHHTCVLTTTGDAYCWGYNFLGQVGIGTGTWTEPSPLQVTGGHLFEVVTAGEHHSCGLTPSGNAYCWGYNLWGQLGIGVRTIQEPTPLPVTGGHTYQAVSAAEHHTCALTSSGDAYCWGNNEVGQLGNGSWGGTWPDYLEPTPLLVTGGHTFVTVSAGGSHTCGFRSAGDAYCWGHNFFGQLGIGTATLLPEPSPVQVTGGHVFRSVSGGQHHTCGLTTTGDVFCWGHNGYGQLGTGTVTYQEPTPLLVTGSYIYQSVSAGRDHTCGLTTTGDAYCWGRNVAGQLGTGAKTDCESAPAPVTGGHTFQAVSAGEFHTCGLTTTWDVYCWGYNGFGQLGTGTVTDYGGTPQFALNVNPGMP